MIKSEGRLEKYTQYIATEQVSLVFKGLAEVSKRETSRKMSKGNEMECSEKGINKWLIHAEMLLLNKSKLDPDQWTSTSHTWASDPWKLK